jgi:hypothetical protein
LMVFPNAVYAASADQPTCWWSTRSGGETCTWRYRRPSRGDWRETLNARAARGNGGQLLGLQRVRHNSANHHLCAVFSSGLARSQPSGHSCRPSSVRLHNCPPWLPCLRRPSPAGHNRRDGSTVASFSVATTVSHGPICRLVISLGMATG